MLLPLVTWYHELTVHSTGMDRLEQMIKRHFCNPKIRATVRHVIWHCLICPKVKIAAPAHGQLAPRDAPLTPWSEVHLDCIGPWAVTVNNIDLVFNALTMIEPVFNLLEIVRIPSAKDGTTMVRLFENHLLSRYPLTRYW